MKPFAVLLERLLFTPQRNAKLALLADYLAHVPDPDRGWGLAALTGALDFRHARPGLVRALVMERTDPVLFAWSYDFVGDLAETAALLWPEPREHHPWPRLEEVVGGLARGSRAELPGLLAGWLDRLDATGRWALLKLVTGGLRVGVSARLARLAVAAHGGRDPAAIEELWHGLEPPYEELFAWLEGRGPPPSTGDAPTFRPLMLANPLEEADLARLAAEAGTEAAGLGLWQVEWKWDGIRVQVVGAPGGARLYSRGGEDISAAFPEILEVVRFEAVLDGELLVAGEDGPASFNRLQQRLNRRSVTPRLLADHPAMVRLYDILMEGGRDLRPLPLLERRARLEAFVARERPARMDLSALVEAGSLDELDRLRRATRSGAAEGLMLKRRDSPYLPGRPRGPWWKWKRDPHTLDLVLMYAQRGHGRRSSYYSDYTFGAWRQGPHGAELVPVGKAYSGYTDAELAALDRWVRAHTVRRYGPVREVEPRLVLEVAFDSLHRSPRHKSGLAMRFPRIHRIRWDKPAGEAELLESLEALVS